MKQISIVFIALCIAASIVSCTQSNNSDSSDDRQHYGLRSSTEVIVTSEGGDKLASKANVTFSEGEAGGITIVVNPAITKQTIVGNRIIFYRIVGFRIGTP